MCLWAGLEGQDVKEMTVVHPKVRYFSRQVKESGKEEIPFHSKEDSLETEKQSLDRADHIKLPSICSSKRRFSEATKPSEHTQ